MVFGPAYKGIPLSVITVIGLQELYGKEARYCSNRKEVKDHGADAGNLLGSELHDGDRVIMVEDVTTSGKSIDETYPVLKARPMWTSRAHRVAQPHGSGKGRRSDCAAGSAGEVRFPRRVHREHGRGDRMPAQP